MCYLSDVVIDGDVGVVVAQYASGAWVYFASENDLMAGVGEAEVASASA
jgi:hypothetical protein